MSRAAGLPEDPNSAAFLIVLAAALLLNRTQNRWVSAGVLALAGAGVLCTLSRGGLVLLLLLVVARPLLPVVSGGIGVRRSHLVAAGAGLAALLAAVLAASWLTDRGLGIFGRRTTQERVELLASGSWLRPQEERLASLGEYWQLIAEAPLAGHGTGFSYTLPRGPHNRFVLEWVNVGVLGLAAYLGWLVAGFRLFQRRRSQAGMLVVLLIAGYSLLQHGVLEVRAVVLALGLLASLSAPAAQPLR
jgi:O-antigen ligase